MWHLQSTIGCGVDVSPAPSRCHRAAVVHWRDHAAAGELGEVGDGGRRWMDGEAYFVLGVVYRLGEGVVAFPAIVLAQPLLC